MKEIHTKHGRGALSLVTLLAALAASMLALFIVAGEAGGAEATPAEDTKATRAQVMQRARSFIGVKYASGYSAPCSREGMNCSCLTRLVYKKFGITLPDSPEAQYRLGARRGMDRLRGGDLVFFSEDHSGRITHTGIYTGKDATGERMILHASNYWNEVVEKPMKYVEGFAGGRDVLPAKPVA